MRAIARAPGKVILFGEHFVVGGEPAIGAAVDITCEVSARVRTDQAVGISSPSLGAAGVFYGSELLREKGDRDAREALEPIRLSAETTMSHIGRRTGLDLTINSDIPTGVGLGSSASVAVSTIAAVSELLGGALDRDAIYRLAFKAESLIHGRPSGIDQRIVTYGGLMMYRVGFGHIPIEPGFDIPLIIANTGIRRSTGDLVARVIEFREKRRSQYLKLAEKAHEITMEAFDALRAGSLHRVGELMYENHMLLVELGVSTAELNRLVETARRAGALGAKLTGAGGGGCIISLVTPEKSRSVAEAINDAGGHAMMTRLSPKGVVAWLEDRGQASPLAWE